MPYIYLFYICFVIIQSSHTSEGLYLYNVYFLTLSSNKRVTIYVLIIVFFKYNT